MSLETDRTGIEQGQHEYEVIKGLKEAHSAAKNWGEREPQLTEVYLTRFIDSMLRIQVGDVNTITMSYQIRSSSEGDVVKLKLPIMRNFEITLTKSVKELEQIEPDIRALLPVEAA